MKPCSSEDISLKSYFLGPQAENWIFLTNTLTDLLARYCEWRLSLFPNDGKAVSNADQRNFHFLRNQNELSRLVETLSNEFKKEIPHFSPRYMGHMFSETSLPGLLGHITALLHNPNNISKESSAVGLKIEGEVIKALCKVFRWKTGTGHLTSGGTLANLEALLRMRNELSQDQWANAKLLTSSAAHYSWKKSLRILGFPDSALLEIPLDRNGRLSTVHLKKVLRNIKDPILGLVTLFGSTERGSIDDIAKVNEIIAKRNIKIWHHVDAAYGGFYACVKRNSGSYLTIQTQALQKTDSLTLDPHKLGYVPYACGTFLCRDSKKYFYNDIEAPYIQFKSTHEVGFQSIEGSRPATGAAATWLTAHSLGFHANGLGRILEMHLDAKNSFQRLLKKKVSGLLFTKGLDLNILCWTVIPKSRKLSKANAWVDQIFHSLPLLDRKYFISKTSLPLEKHPWLRQQLTKETFIFDVDTCHLVRMTLMNPFLMTKETQTRFIDDFALVLNHISQANGSKKKFKLSSFSESSSV